MPEISQEELDRLKASAGQLKRGGERVDENRGRTGPLGGQQGPARGEGLAARTIADYLRAAPRTTATAPLAGGGLSYGNTSSTTPDFRALAAARAGARDAGASVAELQAVDAQQRAQNLQRSTNPFGLNNRQNDALALAWESSPDKQALAATNRDRARKGLPELNSTYGQNYYHTNEDGSRDYNYSKEGTYRGEVPSQFATGDANNPYAAHFNNDTGQWEAGDLSLMATLKDIGKGFTDAYGNIRSTIPQIGGEVVSGFKDLYAGLTGKKEEQAAAQKAADAARAAATHTGATNSAGRNLSSTTVAAPTSAAVNAARAAAQAAASNNRNKQSAGSQQLAAKTRAQLASVKSGSGGALHGGGRNDGGYIYRNFGGPIAESRIREEQIQQQQRAANPQQIANRGGGAGGGLKEQLGKKAIGALLGSATGGLGSMLGGLFNEGGMVHRNMGGPLANPNGYNEGGATNETPIKKVMDEQKLAQQAKAFELEQQRKKEAHDMAMKQKQQAFSQGQQMKQESATTTMKPKAPLGGK